MAFLQKLAVAPTWSPPPLCYYNAMQRDSGAPLYEFFAGGGLARLGLEPDFACVFANDIDPAKALAYRAAFAARVKRRCA